MAEPIARTIVVNMDVREVYALWDDFENFPQFMRNILLVRRLGDRSSHWAMRGPLGRHLEWNAITTVREPFSEIAWQSTQGDLRTSGRVTFRPLGSELTEITAVIDYEPPLGRIGRWFLRHSGQPELRLEEDLQSFKRFAESLSLIGQG